MTTAQQVSMAIAYKETSKAKVAKDLGTTRQNLAAKLDRNTLTKEDLEKIAEALGGKYVAYFEFPDGTKI